ncbi:Retrovirus-related Pol polyprotein from type-1 retrotransposable element [Trichinella zimbabwensis]|uniref:Retrovirus-related Pol polyprotein from type-1 retrotransposable element n=1 Tax=Trichinella zimbabwensis TaxID=268475 RepID=A0A0V1GU87_9BILA|nr:Retrovirus-related Pol polyprotein from type-1 retrotransposable element [Trichinella zimbabwensis]
MDSRTGNSSVIPSLRASDTFRFFGHHFDGEGRFMLDVEHIRSMLSRVKSAPLKPEQKVVLIRSHLLHGVILGSRGCWLKTNDKTLSTIGIKVTRRMKERLSCNNSQMPSHLFSDAYEWINKIPSVPIYYLAKPQPRERAWQNQQGKKTLLSLTLV